MATQLKSWPQYTVAEKMYVQDVGGTFRLKIYINLLKCLTEEDQQDNEGSLTLWSRSSADATIHATDAQVWYGHID